MCRISPVMNGEDPVDDVAYLADTPERMTSSEPVVGFRRVLPCLDDARRDCVDPNAAPGVLDRK